MFGIGLCAFSGTQRERKLIIYLTFNTQSTTKVVAGQHTVHYIVSKKCDWVLRHILQYAWRGFGEEEKIKLKKWESRNLIRQNFWQQAEHSKPYYDQLQMLQIEPFVTPVSQLRDLNFCIRGTSLLQQQLEMCLKHCCYCCFSWTPFVSSCCVCVRVCVYLSGLRHLHSWSYQRPEYVEADLL